MRGRQRGLWRKQASSASPQLLINTGNLQKKRIQETEPKDHLLQEVTNERLQVEGYLDYHALGSPVIISSWIQYLN